MSYRDPITVSGSLVTFYDPDGDGRITNLSAAISPIQDLNGYDHPWPGGGGKNLFYSDTNKTNTVNGVTGTFDAETQTISIVGTNTSSSAYILLTLECTGDIPREVALARTLFNAPGDVYINLVYRKNGVWVAVSSGGSIPAEIDTTINLQIGVYGSATSINATNIKAQIELGSTPTTYAPFSNICPISGRTGLSVYRTGKNLLASLEQGRWRPSDGAAASSNNYIRSPKIFLPPGDYCMSFSNASSASMSIWKLDGTYVDIKTKYTKPSVFTVDEPRIVAFTLYSANGITPSDEPTAQLELGPTATTYAPYYGNTYSITWQTEAGTVYGGTLDVVTGVLTVTHGYVEDNGALNWIRNANGSFYVTNPNAPAVQDADGCMCNYAPFAITFNDVAVFFGSNGLISLGKGWGNLFATADELKTAFSETPVQFVYKLATPLTYQLTQQEVEALLGTNNIWADAGDVTVTYQLARHGFEGWLIKVGTEQTEIPLNFIRYSTYKVTPDQRMEWSAERNVNGVLQRETVPNMPPKIEFNTRLLTNSDVTALMSILNKSFTVASERKLPVYFYDPENNTYKTCDCYMPDIDFKIRNVDTVKNIINYEELRFAFIGY